MNPNVSVTWIELAALALLLVPLAALWAPVKVRRVALTLLQRGVQVVALAAIVACGVFLVWPAGAPDWASSTLEPLSKSLVKQWGEPYRPLAWLVAGTGVALIAAPLAILLGFVRRLDMMAVLLRRVAGAVRSSGAQPMSQPVTATAERKGLWGEPDELDEAVRTMTATVTERPRQTRRRKLAEILDQ